jgi:hypothetical protein
MVWERIVRWLDNPIFVKHVRSRLRLQATLSALVVVQALCLCIAWAGFQLDTFANGTAYGFLLLLQLVIIVVIGGSQVAAAVGGSRSSGILDFHRVSPLSRDELTLGFFFGAPIREYVLLATTMPYALLCVGFQNPSAHGLVQFTSALIALAWLFHGLALLSALLAKPRAGSRGSTGLLVFVMIVFLWMGAGFLFRVQILADPDLQLKFFGIELPWLAVILIYISAALFFIYLAARRRMGSDRIHPLSKIQGIGAVLATSVLCVGGIWKQESYDLLEIVALYFLVGVSIFAVVMITPTQAEYMKGLLRAKKQGIGQLSAWGDLALNRLFLACVCAILLVTGTAIWRAGIGAPLALPAEAVNNYPLGIAMSVLVVAYFGLAMQYFVLRFGARGKMYFGLFLFLAWVLPMIAGTIFMFAAIPRDAGQPGQVIYSLSPIAGIAMSAIAGNGNAPNFTKLVQGAAITPSLFYAFIFNSLLIGAQRREHRRFLTRAEPGKSEVEEEVAVTA